MSDVQKLTPMDFVKKHWKDVKAIVFQRLSNPDELSEAFSKILERTDNKGTVDISDRWIDDELSHQTINELVSLRTIDVNRDVFMKITGIKVRPAFVFGIANTIGQRIATADAEATRSANNELPQYIHPGSKTLN